MQEKYDSSKYYYEQAANYLNQIDNNYHKAHFLGDFARLNAAEGQYERAIEKYNSSIEKAKLGDRRVLLKNNYRGLAAVLPYIGRF